MKIFKQILKRKSDPNTHQNALSKIISRGGGGMPPNPPQNLEKNSCLPPPWQILATLLYYSTYKIYLHKRIQT